MYATQRLAARGRRRMRVDITFRISSKSLVIPRKNHATNTTNRIMEECDTIKTPTPRHGEHRVAEGKARGRIRARGKGGWSSGERKKTASAGRPLPPLPPNGAAILSTRYGKNLLQNIIGAAKVCERKNCTGGGRIREPRSESGLQPVAPRANTCQQSTCKAQGASARAPLRREGPR